jgi:hypothetical protein
MKAKVPKVKSLMDGNEPVGLNQGTDREQGTIMLECGECPLGVRTPVGMDERVRIRTGCGLKHPVSELACPVVSLRVVLVVLKRSEIVDQPTASDPEVGSGRKRA